MTSVRCELVFSAQCVEADSVLECEVEVVSWSL